MQQSDITCTTKGKTPMKRQLLTTSTPQHPSSIFPLQLYPHFLTLPSSLKFSQINICILPFILPRDTPSLLPPLPTPFLLENLQKLGQEPVMVVELPLIDDPFTPSWPSGYSTLPLILECMGWNTKHGVPSKILLSHGSLPQLAAVDPLHARLLTACCWSLKSCTRPSSCKGGHTVTNVSRHHETAYSKCIPGQYGIIN